LSFNAEYNDIWIRALPDEIKNWKIADYQAIGKMNTSLSVDEQSSGLEKNGRGVFCELNIEKDWDFWFGATKDKVLSDFLVMNKSDYRDTIDEHLSKLLLGLIEIGPVCDHAQNNLNNYRYILSLLVPHSSRDVFSSNGRLGVKTGPVKVYESLHLLGEMKHLLVHINYVFSLPKHSRLLGEPRFRLRKQIVDHILHECTNHHARPGMICLKTSG